MALSEETRERLREGGRRGGVVGGARFRELHAAEPEFREAHREKVRASRLKGIAARRERLVESCQEVPCEPFIKRFKEMQAQGEITSTAIAREFGFSRNPSPGSNKKEPYPDGTRALRAFGVKAAKDGRTGAYYYKQTVRYEFAVKLADLLGMDPQDAGI